MTLLRLFEDAAIVAALGAVVLKLHPAPFVIEKEVPLSRPVESKTDWTTGLFGVPSFRTGVLQVRLDVFVVDRGLVESEMNGGFADISASVRIVPLFDAGHAVGFKLCSLRPDSLLAALGFRNGDVVQTVNGYDLSSPDKALELHARLKEESPIDVGLLRDGHPLVFTYIVVR